MPRPRRPFKFWGLAALTGLFTLFGLLIIAVGPTAENRLVGLMCVLFFGVGGFAYLGGPLLTRSGPGTVRRERFRTSAGLEPAFVFPTPRSKQLATTVGAGGMAGGSVLLAVIETGWVVIACAAIFGLFFVFMLLSLRRGQKLVLTPTRVVVDAVAGTVELPWEAVVDVEVFEMPAGRATVDMLGIAASDPEAAVWTRGGVLGRLGSNRTGYDLVVGADTFAGEGEDVVAAIRAYRDDPERRRHIGSEEELARLHTLLPLAGRT